MRLVEQLTDEEVVSQVWRELLQQVGPGLACWRDSCLPEALNQSRQTNPALVKGSESHS